MTTRANNMLTNLRGRLRNTSLPTTAGLMPLFEAVVNSIHAIEEAGVSTAEGEIRIEILRKPQQDQLGLEEKKKPGPEALGDIVGFKITDNGVGFDEANMTSFLELDTDHKAALGGKGIGRLLWLKAFKKVSVRSTYSTGKHVRVRAFQFDAASGVTGQSDLDAEPQQPRQTVIHLDDFLKRYRESSRKTSKAIAVAVLEHCLWYFIRPSSAPEILVCDDQAEESSIRLHDEFSHRMHAQPVPEKLKIKGKEFELTHVKRTVVSNTSHTLAYCAANRLVNEENIEGKIAGLYGTLKDEKGEFLYSCYITSKVLDDLVRPERTSFEILELAEDGETDGRVTLGDIRKGVLERTRLFLATQLEESIKRSKQRIETFVAHRAPRYKPIMDRLPADGLDIDPSISDKDLDIALHSQLANLERELLSEGHEILKPKQSESQEEYGKRIADYIRKAEDIKKSDLANYVAHRRVILDLFEQSIQRKPDGSYAREELIHQLIMPMRKESTDVHFDSCNLWLIDERLAFHDYLSSDKTLAAMPITGTNGTKEPDLCSLSVYDNPLLVNEGTKLPLASIVVVELKCPMRNDAAAGEEKDPIEQALGYLQRIRKGEVTTKLGRPIPHNDDIPGFCYVIADLTPKLAERCKLHHDLTETHDHMGFFGYKRNAKAYVEVISFERLVEAAKQRNRAFFDKLGLPA